MTIEIRPYSTDDAQTLWAMLEPVFRGGDTYAIDPNISREDALAYWCGPQRTVWMACENGQPLGSYYMVPNAGGGGAKVCNCGFVTSTAAQGKGVARAMLAHSLETAPKAGFIGMQFNYVVATNTRAIDTWKRAGFDVAGQLPAVFEHPTHGFVDALVMYRKF